MSEITTEERKRMRRELRGIPAVDRLLDALEETERERDALSQEARHFHCNEMFYRGIVEEIGKPFGVAARTSDDGSVQDSILALKVPELVQTLERQRDALREALWALSMHADGIDNGYCTICRAHRVFTDGKIGLCENPKCISHIVRAALEASKPTAEHAPATANATQQTAQTRQSPPAPTPNEPA